MSQNLKFIFTFSIILLTFREAKSQRILINELLASNVSVNIDSTYKVYSDWIELYNNSNSEINLAGYFLTDNFDNPTKWEIPSKIYIEPNSHLLFWADGKDSNTHTNFKLSKSGEEIGIYSPDTLGIDSLIFGAQQDNISYGRLFEDVTKFAFFDPPSPGIANNSNNFVNITPSPLFSIAGGIYNGPQLINFLNSDQYNIYFTIDGTTPDENSQLYSLQIIIDTTTAVRARTYEYGKPPSDVITNTYFINENVNLPLISIVTDPDNLFSEESGIYVTGTNGTRGSCDPTIRNLNQDWERPVNIELYETDGAIGLNQQAGIKIFGGCSRTRFPEKSFALYARSSYGNGSFSYQLFPDKNIDKFESFLLRSSADDQTSTMFRDALGQYVQVETMDIDYQAYRPAVVYINGVYWGIHNIREKVNEHYFNDNFGIDATEVNLLESNGGVSHGSNAGYSSMVDYAANNNMADQSKYEVVKNQMDINQYIDYQIGHIYLAERDWPGNNIKYWRANVGEYSKWRWINFDLDQTFTYQWISENMIFKTTTANGLGWPNPEWSTRLFRNLLDNEEFKNEFIQRYAWHMNTTFKPERLKSIIDSMSAKIAPEIPRHIVKWGGKLDPDFHEGWPIKPTFNSVELWEANVDTMRIFADERPAQTIQYFIEHFNLSGTAQILVNTKNNNAGKLKILQYDIPNNYHSGTYFKDIPLELEAVPFIGYKFSHWKVGDTDFYENPLERTLTDDVVINAYFEIDSINTSDKIVINEINYNSSADFDTKDWIEIFNNLDTEITLSAWYIQDENSNNKFIFPKETKISAKGFLVVCNNINAFDSLLPNLNNRVGNFDFNLSSNGEVIKLFASNNQLVDSVRYYNDSPWTNLVNGSGKTLELLDSELDNNLAESWEASSAYHGTPGLINSIITNILKDENETVPLEFMLYDNYPNPFNPTTTIKYSIPNVLGSEFTSSTIVKLTIFDALGREIKTLVHELKKPGNYEIIFDATRITSGIYYYQLRANGFLQTKKMVLLK